MIALAILSGMSQSRAAERAVHIVDGTMQTPLTATAGDPERGKRIVMSAETGNCVICHALPIAEIPVFGNVGPSLAGVADRLSVAQIRARLIDPKVLSPETSMPAYYKVDGLTRVAREYAGKPILNAQQLEDVVSYLATLTHQADR